MKGNERKENKSKGKGSGEKIKIKKIPHSPSQGYY